MNTNVEEKDLKEELEPKIEIEIQEEVDPQVKQQEEQEKEETQKRESRVQRLKRQRDAERQRNAELNDKYSQLLQEVETIKKTQGETLKTGYEAAEKNLEEALALAETSYEAAFDSGDKLGVAKAARQIAALEARRVLLGEQKNRLPAARQERPTQLVENRQQVQRPDNRLAEQWAKENPWFMDGSDQKLRRMALLVDHELKEEGYDPASQEYYDEIDARLEEFKEKGPAARAPVQKGQSRPVASATKVTLTKEQVRDAQSKGIPLEVYARNVKLQANDMGYFPIDLES